MLRHFHYLVCAAVVGFASHGGAVSVAPACDHCGTCSVGHANARYAPPTRVRIRWVAVYEDGQMHMVPRAYRVRVSDPATISAEASVTPASGAPASITPALGAPTSQDLASSAQAPTGQVPQGQVQPGQTPPGPATASASPSSPAQASAAPADRLGLANRAQALLQARCVRCHGDQRQESGLDLRSRDTILKGGASGPAIIPGQADQSLALQRVRAGEMPPRGRLSSDEIATLQQWIAAGAPSGSAQ
jgi:mono/diheme cytochrome c family protein